MAGTPSVVAAAGGVLGLAGVAGTAIALVLLHELPTGLSPIHNAVSQYGITQYRLGYRLATICTGVAGLGLAIGVQSDLRGTGAVVVLLVVFALARSVIGWAPMDAPGAAATATGRRHGVLAIVAFASVAFAANRLASALQSTHQWTSAEPTIRVLGLFLVATLVGMAVVGRSSARTYFGAVERAFYAGMLAFLATVSVALIAA